MITSEIEERLLITIGECQSLIPAEQLEDMASLVRAGEPGVALENLCVQLVEYDAKVPEPILLELAALGRAMGLDQKYWTRLGVRPV